MHVDNLLTSLQHSFLWSEIHSVFQEMWGRNTNNLLIRTLMQ